ncbi:hypothetical protein Barb6_00165 [Bacteroidales bacterium Barb6]|nr:hypothetical protein Barb6_00165 [Bacteroidales bacterium Barb6]
MKDITITTNGNDNTTVAGNGNGVNKSTKAVQVGSSDSLIETIKSAANEVENKVKKIDKLQMGERQKNAWLGISKDDILDVIEPLKKISRQTEDKEIEDILNNTEKLKKKLSHLKE